MKYSSSKQGPTKETQSFRAWTNQNPRRI